MKNWTMAMMAGLMSVGVAQADSTQPSLGFDRVGQVSAAATSTEGTRLKAAPGEATEQAIALQARKREMARRLVWLMLSAR